MISLLFILIVMIGIVFSILTFVDEEEVVWPLMAMLTWFIAAVSVFNLEWQVSVANTTGGIITSVVSYTGGWPLSLLFMLFAFIFILFLWFRVLDAFKRRGK
jgi:hypothetical protein